MRQRLSALPPKADMRQRDQHVRFVPKADTRSAAILMRARTALGIPLGGRNKLTDISQRPTDVRTWREFR
jgi:hypothetical protein